MTSGTLVRIGPSPYLYNTRIDQHCGVFRRAMPFGACRRRKALLRQGGITSTKVHEAGNDSKLLPTFGG